jgi:hypothetical protein
MCLAETRAHEHSPAERSDRRRFLLGGGAVAAGTALAVAAPSLATVLVDRGLTVVGALTRRCSRQARALASTAIHSQPERNTTVT